MIWRDIAHVAASLFLFTLTGQTSSIGDQDFLDRADDGVDPGTTKKSQRPAARYEPFGHRARPPKGLRVFGIKLGSSNVAFIGIAPTAKYGPQDLDVGETAIYSATKAIVRLWNTGNLTLDSDADKSADVVVNGGTAKVGRVGDNLTASAGLKTWGGVVETAINALAPGTFTPTNSFAGTGPTAPGSAGNLGTINSGADRFKG